MRPARALRAGVARLVGLAWVDRARARVETQLALRSIRRAPAGDAEAFDFIWDFRSGRLLLRPWQIKSEFLALLRRVEALEARSILELGTGRGGSLFFLARAADDRATIVSVDLEGSHDIVPGPEYAVGGVPRFWHQLKAGGHVTEEIVKSWDQGGYGIGLVRMQSPMRHVESS